MLRWKQHQGLRGMFRAATMLFAMTIVAVSFQTAFALIMGGEGNNPVHDPGWPEGAAAIFNHPARIAYWVGPPFGGGEWHAKCRGGAKALGRKKGTLTEKGDITDFQQSLALVQRLPARL